jgi:hypothetical protein
MRYNRALNNLIEKTLALTDRLEAMDHLIGEERLPVRVVCEAIGIELAPYYEKLVGLKEKDRLAMNALIA